MRRYLLSTYQRLGGQVPGPDDQQIIALSQRLRRLPVHRAAGKRDSFINPAGVAFKLQNIRQVATGRGLGNVSSVDRAIWQEFGGAPELVQWLVDACATLNAATSSRNRAITTALGFKSMPTMRSKAFYLAMECTMRAYSEITRTDSSESLRRASTPQLRTDSLRAKRVAHKADSTSEASRADEFEVTYGSPTKCKA